MAHDVSEPTRLVALILSSFSFASLILLMGNAYYIDDRKSGLIEGIYLLVGLFVGIYYEAGIIGCCGYNCLMEWC